MSARLVIAAVAASALAGCASTGQVILSPHYDSSHIRSVALAGIQDYPPVSGSGKVAAGIFEKYLLLGGYRLVDRSQAEQALEDQGLASSGALDLSSIRSIGKRLGVDALAFGQLSDFSEASDRTVIEDLAQEESEPIYGRQETTQRIGDTKVRTEQDVVVGYNTYTTHTPVQETLESPAHVGISVRLVDAQSGEMLWSGSASGQGTQTHEAMEEASAELMKAVAGRLKALQKSP
jgi:hypothetical protein